MEWVALLDYENGMNMNDAPRLLTEEEIAYITSHIPYAPCADMSSAEITRQGVVEWVVETLKELALSPSAIPELIQNIIKQHNKSLVVPGTPVGIAASETVGASTTQMTLNSVAPWERIIIQKESGKGILVAIGDWIDELLAANSNKIKHIPENRTQYLELDEPVRIATPDKDGNVKWDKLTAVTKHLPVGDLVKITTKSGREVTATQSKSLLIWNGEELVGVNGSSIKVGDLVPILCEIPEPYFVNNTFSKENGIITGKELSKSADPFPVETFFCNKEYLEGILEGYFSDSTTVQKLHLDSISFIRSRLNYVYDGYQTHNNVMLDPIVSVELVPPTEYVYDVTVPATLNFSLFNGLGMRDTFHSSGSATSASFGINAMRDLIFARKVPKNENSTIYFTNKAISYEEVLDTRRFIVGSVVQDFIRDYDIDSPARLERFWWHDAAPSLLGKTIPASHNVLRLYLNTVEMFKQKVTIAQLAAVLEREVPPSSLAIYGPISDGIIDVYPVNVTVFDDKIRQQLTPDLVELTYLETIVVPQLPKIRVKGIAGIRSLFPIVSPVWRIVLHERKLTEKDLVTERLRNDFQRHLGYAWLLFLNKSTMKMTGLLPENLSALCTYAGITVAGYSGEKVILIMPNDNYRAFNGETVYNFGGVKHLQIDPNNIITVQGIRYKEINSANYKQVKNGWKEQLDENLYVDLPENIIIRRDNKLYKVIDDANIREYDGKFYEVVNNNLKINEIKPNEYVAAKVNKAKTEYRAEVNRLKAERNAAAKNLPPARRAIVLRKPIILERPPIMKAAEFVIADTTGNNLKKLLALPGIDKKRTVCNNMHTICDTLGIEATRTFLIQALHNTIANTGNYVNPNNILLIAEFITNRGKPYGATYTGISRQSGGHLSLATLERAGKVFTQNALHGRHEDIRNVSASVAVGARMAIGTGFFDVAQDITENGVTHTFLNEEVIKALNRDDQTKERIMQLQQQEQVAPADLDDAINALNALKLGGATFDYTGEDETNLIGLFNQGEIIEEVVATTENQTSKQHKVVRRVQPSVPTNLIDALAQIKMGIPLPEKDARIEITPLESGITIEETQPVPIISSGLIPGLHVPSPQSVANAGIPEGLQQLLNKYFGDADVVEQPPINKIVELPVEPMNDLPSLQDLSVTLEMRQEQVRNLEPIDITKVEQGLAE